MQSASFVVSWLAEVAFDLHVSLTNTVRLVPMQLDFAQRAVGQSNCRDAFEFAPVARAMMFVQMAENPNSSSCGDCFDISDGANDFKSHWREPSFTPLRLPWLHGFQRRL
ncbi:MAG TPA: hypothetical protein VL171_03225 [Verrucomicrobiae bacterium]|nr:hypothetical protein [Verrucomicrobiae bacterium]